MQSASEQSRAGKGGLDAATTVPALFIARCQATPGQLAYKAHAGGGWHAVTWQDFERKAREVAASLVGLGLAAGERVGVVAETRAEWGVCDLAVLLAGCVTVGVYPTSAPQQCQYILEHAGCAIVFVDSAAQLEKLRLVRDQLPALRQIIVWDAPADLHADRGELSLYRLIKAGHSASAEAQQAVEARWQAVKPEDPANLVYTSGTTGPPKGAILSHANILALLNAGQIVDFRSGDITISFLPMCHVAEKVVSFYGRLRFGIATAYARSLDFQKLLEDFQTIRPTVFGAVPRIFEKVYARATMRAEATATGRRVFRWAVGVGRAWSQAQRGDRRLSLRLRTQHALADRLVFQRVRDLFGGQVRIFITGAAPIQVEILEFFHAAGMLVLEAYGMTETTAISTANRPEAFRFGTVGRVVEGVQLRIAEDGEILVKGPTVFQGYLHDPEATAEAVQDGWMYTGDIGALDADGFLTITDRKKNIIITSGGKNIAPQGIEGLVKEDPFIASCVVIGDRRNFLAALLALDEDEAPQLAERLGIPYRGPERMAADPQVRAYLHTVIEGVNQRLSRVEQLRTFRVLPRDLSIEEGELTPTLKVRRQVVEARYASLITEMYGAEE